MRKNEVEDFASKSTVPGGRRSLRRKNRGRAPVKSRYFPKIVNRSFRLGTRFVFETKARPRRATGKKKTQNSKAVTPVTKTIENEDDQILDYSLFAENCSKKSVKVNGATSDYFLRSQLSPYESVRSLGPLVYTWINGYNPDEIRLNCSRLHSTSGSNRNQPCSACSRILTENAFRHFLDCPIFRGALDSYKFPVQNEENHSRIPCVEIVGRFAEDYALRHLCRNQCFMRAFAPSREWINLRKNLRDLTPVGEILNDWTCRLVHETDASSSIDDTEGEGTEQISPGRKLQPQRSLPRTMFISLKTGEVRKSVRFQCLL